TTLFRSYCLASAPTYNQCGFTGTKIQNSKTNGALADNETAALQYPQFPYLNQINQQGNLFFSNYNALQITLNERTSHGLSFLAGYTFSHALDFLNGVGWGGPGATTPTSSSNFRVDYGTSGNDIRNRFTLSLTYTVTG